LRQTLIFWLFTITLNIKRWLDVGSSESKAKGSFGQKQFYFSNMGETALEEEPRGTLNIMIFLKTNIWFPTATPFNAGNCSTLGNQSIHPVAYFYK
jgi:hypothetical protein